MSEPRLATTVWVQAQVRVCDRALIPIGVLHAGDPERGSVLVKVNRLGPGCTVYAQARDAQGRAGWIAATGSLAVTEAQADAYIARALEVDPDLWVIEVEDRDGRYALDAPIL